jgi:hypothetical protein
MCMFAPDPFSISIPGTPPLKDLSAKLYPTSYIPVNIKL